MAAPALFTGVDAASLRARQGAKWNRHPEGVLAAWVADMDFQAAQPIRDAIIWTAEHSAFGYGRQEDTDTLLRACSDWMQRRHGWGPDPETGEALVDIVQGINAAIYTLTEPGDGVIVQGPIYPPFLNGIETLGRVVVDNRLLDVTGSAELDLEGLRTLAAGPRTRLLMLCNPHNPSGRVLRRGELEAIAAIAIEHDLTVLSDEIWMDVTYPGHRHIPIASLSPEIAARTITMTSATKSFNLGGVRCAVAFYGSPELRERYHRLPERIMGRPSIMGVRATIAAWNESEQWFNEVLPQLDGNRQALDAFLRERLALVRHRTPEGTYLAWLDFAAYNLSQPAADHLLERAKVALNAGPDFGGGESFARLNFATTPELLTEILERIAAAV